MHWLGIIFARIGQFEKGSIQLKAINFDVTCHICASDNLEVSFRETRNAPFTPAHKQHQRFQKARGDLTRIKKNAYQKKNIQNTLVSSPSKQPIENKKTRQFIYSMFGLQVWKDRIDFEEAIYNCFWPVRIDYTFTHLKSKHIICLVLNINALKTQL